MKFIFGILIGAGFAVLTLSEIEKKEQKKRAEYEKFMAKLP